MQLEYFWLRLFMRQWLSSLVRYRRTPNKKMLPEGKLPIGATETIIAHIQ